MQIEEVQAFVRLLPNSGWFPIRDAHKPMHAHLAGALLLPNCTAEVSIAIKARLADGAAVRDLRVDVSAEAVEIAGRWKDDLAQVLDMPEGQPFAEYVESVRRLVRYREERRNLGDCAVVSGAEYEVLRLDNERLRAEVERLKRNRFNVLADESIPRGKLVFWDPNAPKSTADKNAYNQGCADTVAAFRKAQGDA